MTHVFSSSLRARRTFTGWTVGVLLIALCSLLPGVAQGQSSSLGGGLQSASGGDASWTAEALPEAARPGEHLTVRVDFDIDAGWHMYAMDSPVGQSLEVTFDSLAEGFTLQPPLRQSPPTEEFDPNFQDDAYFYDGTAEVRAGLQVADSLQPGTYELGGSVRYMVCNDDMCMPPRTKPFSVTVDVEEGASRAAYGEADFAGLVIPESDGEAAASSESSSGEAGAAESVAASGAANAASGDGLFAFLLLAAGAGLGALLMPCVFPMIPLTVSYFTGRAESRRESFRQAGVYGLTIVATFTGLGALAAALLGASGAQTIAANPWVNLAIGGVLAVFALSLLGLFELRLPSSFVNYFNRQSNERGGYAGSVFMGLTLTVVSFSCTAPFVGGLLAAAAQGTWAYPVLGMLVFSGVLALPFIGFALFPGAMERLPSSGGWMNVLKVTFGFVELAAALKFFSNADLVWGTMWLPRPLVIALTVVLFALAGFYLLGKLRLPGDVPAGKGAAEPSLQAIGVGRLMAATLFLGLALYMTPGLWGASLGRIDAYLPPRQATDPGRLTMAGGAGETPVDELDWHTDDIDAALADAEASDKPVFIDFSGYTCTNCREMEANVFPEPAVADHLREDFVLLRLYTDDAEVGPQLQRYQQDLTGTVAMPTYAVVTPEEQLVVQHSGMAAPDAFSAFLQEGLSGAGAPGDVASASGGDDDEARSRDAHL